MSISTQLNFYKAKKKLRKWFWTNKTGKLILSAGKSCFNRNMWKWSDEKSLRISPVCVSGRERDLILKEKNWLRDRGGKVVEMPFDISNILFKFK